MAGPLTYRDVSSRSLNSKSVSFQSLNSIWVSYSSNKSLVPHVISHLSHGHGQHTGEPLFGSCCCGSGACLRQQQPPWPPWPWPSPHLVRLLLLVHLPSLQLHCIQHQEEVLVSQHQHRTACMANSTIDLATLRSSNTASLHSLGMSCSPVPLRVMPARPRVCAWRQRRTLAYTWQGRG